MEIGEVFSLAVLSALIVKVTTWLKFIRARDWNAVITQVVTWVAGVVAVMIAAQADVAEGLTVFGSNVLADLDAWSQVLAGIALASGGSVALYDFRKAFDGSDSAKEPPLTGAPGG